MQQDIIAQLRARRYEVKLSLRQLSEKIGYHDNTIWQWETKRAVPSFRSLHDWAEGLGMALELKERRG